MKYQPDPVTIARWLSAPLPVAKINGPESALLVLSGLLTSDGAPFDEERFAILGADRASGIVAADVLTIGSAEHCIVDTKQVMRWALTRTRPVAAIIVGHNHPSGSSEPSTADREVTRRLRDAGQIIGVKLLDHLIVGAGNFFSFAQHGLI